MEASKGRLESLRIQIRAKRLLKFVLRAFIAHRASFLHLSGSMAGEGISTAAWSSLLDIARRLTGTALPPLLSVLSGQLAVSKNPSHTCATDCAGLACCINCDHFHAAVVRTHKT